MEYYRERYLSYHGGQHVTPLKVMSLACHEERFESRSKVMGEVMFYVICKIYDVICMDRRTLAAHPPNISRKVSHAYTSYKNARIYMCIQIYIFISIYVYIHMY